MTPSNPFNPTGLTAKQVDQYHVKDDVDSGSSAHHHTLGWSVGQAASGFDVKTALDQNDSNLDQINQLIADLAAAQTDLAAQQAELALQGKVAVILKPAAQSFPVGVDTVVTWAGEEEDFNPDYVPYTDWFSYNAGVLTLLTDQQGVFTFESNLCWNNSASAGRRILAFEVSYDAGVTWQRHARGDTYTTGNNVVCSNACTVPLNVGDRVRIRAFWEGGGAGTNLSSLAALNSSSSTGQHGMWRIRKNASL